MIAGKFVDLYARDSGLRDKLVAERDVVLTYALRALCETGVMDALAFKGGTCLRKTLFGNRQVQRHVADLEAAGLVEHEQRWSRQGGKTKNSCDLGGPVERLRLLEPEFREVEERAKEARKAVSRPKYRRIQPANGREPA